MEKVYVVSISKHSESSYESEEDRKVPRMLSGVLRIFQEKEDAKKYIEMFYSERATDNGSLNVHDKKKGDYQATLCDWYEEDEHSVTFDGISLKGCKTKITIKVYQMNVTPSSENADIDDDMYDLLAGEETERAITY